MNPLLTASDNCIICLLGTGDIVTFSGSCACRPRVHTGCLERWFERNSRTCPICRASYPAKNVAVAAGVGVGVGVGAPTIAVRDAGPAAANRDEPGGTCVLCCCCYMFTICGLIAAGIIH